jgi:mono/diheme cytochrome c family protein
MDGDPRRGEKLFSASCVLCHRDKGVLPELNFAADVSLVLAKIRSMEVPDDVKVGMEDDYPPMPFFSAERLSDQQVADILAHWDYMKFTREQSAQEETAPEESTVEMLIDSADNEAENNEDSPAEHEAAA